MRRLPVCGALQISMRQRQAAVPACQSCEGARDESVAPVAVGHQHILDHDSHAMTADYARLLHLDEDLTDSEKTELEEAEEVCRAFVAWDLSNDVTDVKDRLAKILDIGS